MGNTYFLHNSVSYEGGGGISYSNYNSGYILLLLGNSYFIANRAESEYLSNGGAVAISGSFTITFALFIENSAAFGGAIYTEGNFFALGEFFFSITQH